MDFLLVHRKDRAPSLEQEDEVSQKECDTGEGKRHSLHFQVFSFFGNFTSETDWKKKLIRHETCSLITGIWSLGNHPTSNS